MLYKKKQLTPNMPYDSIIFDIDGTLWNPIKPLIKGYNQGIKRAGIKDYKIKESDLAPLLGQPADLIFEILLKDYLQNPDLEKIINQSKKEVLQKEGGVFYKDVKTGIKKLAKKYRLFIISNCLTWYLEIFLKKSDFQDQIIDSDCFGKSRLSKQVMIEKMVKKHNLKNPVYVGDTQTDYESVKKTGIDYIHVNYGFGKVKQRDFLKFDDFGDLVNKIFFNH
jgi:phosphoglycolate phosphatase